MAFAQETGVKAASDFGLPRWVILPETLANIFSQFQPLSNRQLVRRAFEFDNAHQSTMALPPDIFKRNIAGTALALAAAPTLKFFIFNS
jgi:hypothetical protein